MSKQTTSKNKKGKKTEYYVNPKEFYSQIKTYYETDDLCDTLAESVHKIAIGLSYATNFINYTYKDEMVGDAVVKMFTALKHKKFNIESHSNPFSYFTTIAYHAFINRIKKEKRYKQTINEYQETVYEEIMCTEGNGKVYVKCADENETDIYND
tara:strand:+ start:960 stop:1421 length:462 start_codon:yes stop_codon:yes gene_type:complete